MAKTSLLPRGFKANSERIAVEYRKQLDLAPYHPLCGFKLAQHLNIPVYYTKEFFPLGTDLTPLIGVENKDKGFSAVTIRTKVDNTIIILNDLQAPTRQQSNIMHELAHVICKHEHITDDIYASLPSFMRKYDQKSEEEATHLGSVLQIPRDGLLWSFKNKMQPSEISEYFLASNAMLTQRINATGIKNQLGLS